MCNHGEDDEEDDFGEDGSDDEPSLGSGAVHEHSTEGSGLWANPGTGALDAEDEHDGAEPENEHGDGDPDGEPNLGWTVDGCISATSDQRDECELQEHAPYRPQERTDGPGVTASDRGYGGYKVLRGLLA